MYHVHEVNHEGEVCRRRINGGVRVWRMAVPDMHLRREHRQQPLSLEEAMPASRLDVTLGILSPLHGPANRSDSASSRQIQQVAQHVPGHAGGLHHDLANCSHVYLLRLV